LTLELEIHGNLKDMKKPYGRRIATHLSFQNLVEESSPSLQSTIDLNNSPTLAIPFHKKEQEDQPYNLIEMYLGQKAYCQVLIKYIIA